MRKNHLALAVSTIVVLIWTIVILVGLFTHDYTALSYITPIMIGVISYLFGDNLLRKRITADE
jgi:hypothetical protein